MRLNPWEAAAPGAVPAEPTPGPPALSSSLLPSRYSASQPPASPGLLLWTYIGCREVEYSQGRRASAHVDITVAAASHGTHERRSAVPPKPRACISLLVIRSVQPATLRPCSSELGSRPRVPVTSIRSRKASSDHMLPSVLYSGRRAVQAIGRIDRGADQNEGLNRTLMLPSFPAAARSSIRETLPSCTPCTGR